MGAAPPLPQSPGDDEGEYLVVDSYERFVPVKVRGQHLEPVSGGHQSAASGTERVFVVDPPKKVDKMDKVTKKVVVPVAKHVTAKHVATSTTTAAPTEAETETVTETTAAPTGSGQSEKFGARIARQTKETKKSSKANKKSEKKKN